MLAEELVLPDAFVLRPAPETSQGPDLMSGLSLVHGAGSCNRD